MAKNPYGKTRPVDRPYEVYRSRMPIMGGIWEWNVLKHWQSPEAEAENPYARVFCNVVTPICPDGELGDTYLKDILSCADLVKVDHDE